MRKRACIACETGVYVTHVEVGPDAGGIEALRSFGLLEPPGIAAWTIKVCNACGNVQVFRPDLVATGAKGSPSPVP